MKVWSRDPRRWKRVQSVEWIQDWPCIANNTWILHLLGPVRHRLCYPDSTLKGPAEASSSSYEPTQRPAAVSLLLLHFPGGLRLWKSERVVTESVSLGDVLGIFVTLDCKCTTTLYLVVDDSVPKSPFLHDLHHSCRQIARYSPVTLATVSTPIFEHIARFPDVSARSKVAET